MLSDKDVQKLIKVFATRDEVVSKSELGELKRDFGNIQLSIDSYAKRADAYFQEMAMFSHKIDRQERWIQEIAKKIGMKLDY